MSASRRNRSSNVISFLLLAGILTVACNGEAERGTEGASSDSDRTGTAAEGAADTAGGSAAEPATDPDPSGGSDTPDDSAEGWREAPVVGGAAGVHALLTAVRTARHDGYDRIVFQFDSGVPAYAVRYVEEPFACGSGNPVEVGAAAALEVEFRAAAAHNDAGEVTVADRERAPGYPTLRTARISCDFEGEVTWVLGVERPGPVRVLELGSPARLVLDLRQR